MPTIIDAAKSLIAVCDGATSRDTQGFNGSDAPFVKSIFERKWLSEKQLASLHRLLKKYTVQLSKHGFAYGELVVPMAGPATSATGSNGVPHDPLKTQAVAQMKITDTEWVNVETPLPPPRNIFARLNKLDPFVKPVTISKEATDAAMKAIKEAFKPAPWAPEPWSVDAGDIMNHFPKFLPDVGAIQPRGQQREVIEKADAAYRAGKRVVVIELATGGGKSIVAMTLGNALRANGDDSFFITAQIALQRQYTRDFPSPEIELLLGRSNYKCNLDCSRKANDAPCTDEKRGILPECVDGGLDSEIMREAVQLTLPPSAYGCDYWRQLAVCNRAPIMLANFASFLFQKRIGRFSKRSLLILDEAHNCEAQLMNFVSIELTEWVLSIIDVKIDRNVTSKEQFLEWLRENDVTRKISNKLDPKDDVKGDDCPPDGESISSELSKTEHDAMKELGHKIEIFMRYVERGEWSISTETYFVRGDPRKKILARPIYAKEFAEELLFQHADRVLAMSATILDKDLWARNLGLDPADVEIISLASDFPAENRPIFLTYAGNMGKKHFSPEMNPTNPTKPKFIEAVRRIMKRHEGQRGLIHCQSNDLKRVILDEVRDSRFLDQETFENNKEEMMKFHASRPDSVIVAPAMHEGFDFKGDLCRFQIIAKMPWPSLGDKVVKERSERDPAWYTWLCALKLAQSYGRAVRSSTDWAYTYLLDQGFEMFAGRNGKLIPQWVRDAFQRYAPTEIRRS